MKILKKYILLLLLLSTTAWGQELMVREFYLDAEDLCAVQEQVLDHNNKPCALIKVRLPDYQLFFEGDVIYWENKGNNEYWVYMSSGATWLQIKSPVASPLTYDFRSPVEGLRTYIMQLHLTLSRAYRQQLNSTQELLATTFREDKNDNSNDDDDALVKVRLESFALTFSGEIDIVVPRWNEYWVYMSDGATRLEIRTSIAPPLTYDFGKKLKKGHTYVLQLELKNPVTLPKVKEKPETYNRPQAEQEPKELRSSSYLYSTSIKDKVKQRFISLQFGTAVNALSYEYGVRYGELFVNSGWYGEVVVASSTLYYVDYEDWPISNSENLHLVVGGMLGSSKGPLMGSFGFGCTLGIGTNGSFGLIGECGLTARLNNILISVDFEPTIYMREIGYGTTTVWGTIGHYLKFGIGYTF